MKKFFLMSLIVVSFLSCSKEEPINFRVYDLDIYSIPINEEATQQEVYASVKVEGFKTEKENGNYKFHILLEADLVTPENKTIQTVAKLDTTGVQSEKFSKYLNLDLSFVLDENYPHGKYQLILRGKDFLSQKESKITQEFNLD
ncbi:MAG: hypothetical protein N3F03_04875 [Ignavibacteria bacterium]|nr:hypothetical protein [Ignavibacteria bacterium]